MYVFHVSNNTYTIDINKQNNDERPCCIITYLIKYSIGLKYIQKAIKEIF